jgi:deoxycytidine triphosphate deaminase
MILGTTAIEAALESGAIHCDPAPARIEGAHIDVRLGRYYWHWNVYPSHVAPNRAILLNEANAYDCLELKEATDLVFIEAYSFILAHTIEYIGTAPGSGLLPTLHTRSSLARWGLGCHPSAGWGDEGYMSRWTLEIVNPHPVAVALPVGARVGSIAFERIEGAATVYQGRYNVPDGLWTPEAMLPRKGNLL